MAAITDPLQWPAERPRNRLQRETRPCGRVQLVSRGDLVRKRMGGSEDDVICFEFTPIFSGTGVGQSVSWSSLESPLESVGLTR